MKITDIKQQAVDFNRANIFVDGVYFTSLDISQIVDYKIKIGKEISEDEAVELKNQSVIGKLFQRTLEFCLIRPRSLSELDQYLYKKTISKKLANGKIIEGASHQAINAVRSMIVSKKYVDDLRFAEFWVNNRFIKKGISSKRLYLELLKKGISGDIAKIVIANSERDDRSDIIKVIKKKINKYDEKGLIQYLARQGFLFDDIKKSIAEYKELNTN